MNYYVISPNVWNDGNWSSHVDFMVRNSIVCMGWDRGNRWQRVFAVFRLRTARGAVPTNTPRINIFPGRIYNLENLFTRLNTMGSRISAYDLSIETTVNIDGVT